jgi:hypothetical protein
MVMETIPFGFSRELFAARDCVEGSAATVPTRALTKASNSASRRAPMALDLARISSMLRKKDDEYGADTHTSFVMLSQKATHL